MGENSFSQEEFIESIRFAFQDFMETQTEYLRLAQHLRKYSVEIDSQQIRVEEELRRRLDTVQPSAIAKLEDVFAFIGNEKITDVESVAVQAALEELIDQVEPDLLPAYLDSYVQAYASPRGAPMLLSSMLVSLVGALEIFVSNVIKDILRLMPHVLSEKDIKFSFSELSGFSDMKEVSNYVIDKFTTDLIRGEVEAWFDFLNNKFGLKVPSNVSTYPALELFQRRNLIVHNGSKVSQIYINKLKKYKLNVEIGQKLPVTDEYFERSADVLFVIAFELFSNSVFKFCKESDVRNNSEYFIADQIFRLLQHSRLELAKNAVSCIDQSKMVEERAQLFLRVNGWIAHKRSGFFDDCREEVENFNVSARSNEFKLAKLALLDQHADAFSLAQDMLTAGELQPIYWQTWPLLSEVRAFGSVKLAETSESNGIIVNEEGDTMFDLDK